MLSKLDFMVSIEERVAKIKGILEQMNERISKLENEVSHLRSEMHSQFRWLTGLILGMWITVICTLIPILLRLLGVI